MTQTDHLTVMPWFETRSLKEKEKNQPVVNQHDRRACHQPNWFHFKSQRGACKYYIITHLNISQLVQCREQGQHTSSPTTTQRADSSMRARGMWRRMGECCRRPGGQLTHSLPGFYIGSIKADNDPLFCFSPVYMRTIFKKNLFTFTVGLNSSKLRRNVNAGQTKNILCYYHRAWYTRFTMSVVLTSELNVTEAQYWESAKIPETGKFIFKIKA